MINNKNILLYPLARIWGMITGFRNFLYNSGVLKSVEFHLPVICVGNITVGGTGKTPHTEYIADLLRKNFKVATLSRGYKRTSRGFRIASPETAVREIGDEPMQMFRKLSGVLVAVDRNRVNGVNRVLEEAPDTEVIILDDAFQHRRITPGFSILLTDFERLIVRDHLMPFGSLRESAGNMRRADIIIVSKSPENISPIQRRIIVKEIDKSPYQNLYFTSMVYKDPLPVFENLSENAEKPDLMDPVNCGIVLITGIANPQPFKEYLLKSFGEIIHLSFPDHYAFREKDIQAIALSYQNLKSTTKYLITTEKDAVRLREFTNIAEPLKSAFFYIPIGIHFLNDDKDEFDNLIVDYVRKNKRNNRVSESQRDKKS
ncbi:MAG: tetraacyldisaccharide 4'-kinase [Bacteroidales bacterium]|nr:tetraacyldisaccharide 4'-kinase [Bacteroidales bacterium]